MLALPPEMRPIQARSAAHGRSIRKPGNAEWAHFGRSPEGFGHDSASLCYRLLACGKHATRAMPCADEIMAEVAAVSISVNRP